MQTARVKRHRPEESFISVCSTLERTQSVVNIDRLLEGSECKRRVGPLTAGMANMTTLRQLVRWPPRQIACGSNRLLLEGHDELVISVEPVHRNQLNKPFAELDSERLLRRMQEGAHVPLALLPFTWGFVALSSSELKELAPRSAAFTELLRDKALYEKYCVVRVLAAAHCSFWDAIRLPQFSNSFLISCALDVLAKLTVIQSHTPDFVHGDLHVANVMIPSPSGSQSTEWLWTVQTPTGALRQRARTRHTLLIDFDLSTFEEQHPVNDLSDLWLADSKVTVHRDRLEDVLKFLRSFSSACTSYGRQACARSVAAFLDPGMLRRKDDEVAPSTLFARKNIRSPMDAFCALRSNAIGLFEPNAGKSTFRVELPPHMFRPATAVDDGSAGGGGEAAVAPAAAVPAAGPGQRAYDDLYTAARCAEDL